MKGIVIIPCWRRPEFLAVCLERIQQAEGWEDYVYRFCLDHGNGGKYDPKCLEVIHAFQGQYTIVINTHSTNGNSFNILTGYSLSYDQASAQGWEFVHLIEDDIFVSPDYFRFHEAAHAADISAFFVSACRNQNLKEDQIGPFDRVYRHQSYQSLGVSFRTENLPEIIRHNRAEFYRGQTRYLKQHFPNASKDAYHTEQDGLIYRVVEAGEHYGLFPYVPRAYHAGFTGYNRPASATHRSDRNWQRADWRAKAEMLKRMTDDEMNQRAGRPEYRDIQMYPVRDERTSIISVDGSI